MTERHKALAALAGAMLLVGSSVAVGREMVATLPVHFASMIRFALATAILAPIVMIREGSWPHVSRKGLALLCGQALCGSFLFTVCLLYGLTLTGAADAGIISATTPAAVAIMGCLFFHERLALRAWAGIAAAMAGIAVLQAQNHGAAGSAPLAGTLLVLAAVVFEAVFLLLRRILPDPLSPLSAALWISLLGLAYFLIPGIWQMCHLNPAVLTPGMDIALLYYGLGVTALAYMLWFYGIVRVDAALAGVMTGLMPVSALGCAALLCGEHVGWREIGGCGGVLVGILCLAGRGTPKALPISSTRKTPTGLHSIRKRKPL